MERFVQATSGFDPVNRKLQQNVSVKKPQKNVSEEKHGDQHWSGYQDCVSRESMLQNYSNFKRSEAPERLMEWYGGEWVELPSDVLSRARSAFSNGIPMVEIEVGGNLCIFDFYRMLKVEVGSSGLQRSIAWIDLKGSCFFPKFFVDESLLNDDDDEEDDYDDEQEEVGQKDEHSSNGKNPKIEIEINVDTNDDENNNDNKNKNMNNIVLGSIGKRKREGNLVSDIEDTADSCNNETKAGNVIGIGNGNGNGNPKLQRVVPAEKFSWPNVRLMSEEEKSFSDVKNLFLGGMRRVDPGVEVTAIHKFTCIGPNEKARFLAFHKKMQVTQVSRAGRSATVFAWHGTSRKGVSDILAHGFGVPSKLSGLQAHGVGVYLSPARLPYVSDRLVEADDNGEKHVLLCRVILGNLEKVEAGSQQFYPSSAAFDNGVDDTANPKWFVVWTTNMNTHIFPECVVSYKCSNTFQGTNQGDEAMQWVPDGPSKLFFSQLGIVLPPAKLQQLEALCKAYKAGKLPKALFIQNLKKVVGNEMLYSAMAKLQGSN